MAKSNLSGFFESFIEQKTIFANKSTLQSNYTPDVIPHRDQEIKNIANMLAPAFRLEKPSNLFVYGKTGTGKTLALKYILKEMNEVSLGKEIPLKVVYVNCKLKRTADTEYRLIATLSRLLGRALPPTGLPTDEIYRLFFDVIDSQKQLLIFVLDEIDQIVKKTGDEVIYNLVRINEELKQSQISIVGISNDMLFAEHLDPRVKSSMSEEEMLFAPYNALQIQNILRKRTKAAFREGVVDEGVIEKCAAYAAREHGDARRAIELLRVAGELADRSKSDKLTVIHLDEAEDKIERDRMLDAVSSQPRQYQAVLYAIVTVARDMKKNVMHTGEIYGVYQSLCPNIGLRPLTQRRVSDVIGELDMIGLIRANIISKGRYGRTREVSLTLSSLTKKKAITILRQALGLE